MANLYDKAGLVNIPVGYQDGFLYNIKPEDNTLGFRFNRDSAATRVNKEGLIEQVGYFGPELVNNGDFSELGSELVTNGNFNTDSDWNTEGVSSFTIANGILNCFSDGPYAGVSQNIVLEQGKTYKLELDIVRIGENSGSLNFGDQIGSILLGIVGVGDNLGKKTIYFTPQTTTTKIRIYRSTACDIDLDNVSVKQVDPNDYWTLGTGWSFGDNKAVFTSGTSGILFQSNIVETGKLYKLTFDVIRTSGFITSVFLGGVSDNTDINQSGSYTYYITSINQDVLGFNADSTFNGSISNISVTEVQGDKPRIDYTDSLTSPSFLLEPQSTNLVTYSEDFTQWTLQSGTTVTSNTTETLSPSGEYNASKIVGNGTSGLFKSSVSTSGGTNTKSIYIKGTQLGQVVYLKDPNQTVNNKALTLTTDWQRYTLTESQTSSFGIWIQNIPTSGVYMWGAQVESLSYATSYIPTAGSTATRAQETCVGAGSASTFNSTEGVLYAEMAALTDDQTSRAITLSNGTTSNEIRLYFNAGSSNQIVAFLNLSGTYQCVLVYTSSDITQQSKIAFKYKQNDFSLYIDGVERVTDTSGNTFSSNTLNKLSFAGATNLNNLYGKVKGVYVFNEALTDDELQQLTGPEYNSFAALAAAYNYTVI